MQVRRAELKFRAVKMILEHPCFQPLIGKFEKHMSFIKIEFGEQGKQKPDRNLFKAVTLRN